MESQKLNQKDLSLISNYLSEVEIELALNESYILPFLHFEESCRNLDHQSNEFHHKHIHSYELQDRSRFKTLFDEVNGIGSITIQKQNKYYILGKTFYIGNPYCLSENLEHFGVEESKINSVKRELFFPTLEQNFELSRKIIKYLNNGRDFREIDCRVLLRRNSSIYDSDSLIHLFNPNVYMSEIFGKPKSLFYQGTIISLKPLKTRTFEEARLLEDILKFHEFFETLKQ